MPLPFTKRVVATSQDRLRDVRDRALILIDLAGGFRRSELVALDVSDLTLSEDGARARIRRSKGDQEGSGQVVRISRTGSAMCPVAALEVWIGVPEISEGHAFRRIDRHNKVGESLSDCADVLILKDRTDRAGPDPQGFSGYSLRAGFARRPPARSRETRHHGDHPASIRDGAAPLHPRQRDVRQERHRPDRIVT